MITFIACRYLSYLRLKYLATGLDDILKQALIGISKLPYASFPKRGLELNYSYENDINLHMNENLSYERMSNKKGGQL